MEDPAVITIISQEFVPQRCLPVSSAQAKSWRIQIWRRSKSGNSRDMADFKKIKTCKEKTEKKIWSHLWQMPPLWREVCGKETQQYNQTWTGLIRAESREPKLHALHATLFADRPSDYKAVFLITFNLISQSNNIPSVHRSFTHYSVLQ